MSKTDKIGWLILILVISSISYLAIISWNYLETNGYQSCIYSIANAVNQSGQLPLIVGDSKDWFILTETQTDALLSNIQPGDCKKSQKPNFDLWGRKIKIALRKSKDTIEIMIWSVGQDGKSGTDDDIVFPFGEKTPQLSY